MRYHIAGIMDFDVFFWQENYYWVVAAIAGIVAIIAGYADRRRTRRSDFEKVGYVPWTTITVLAGITAFSFVIYALASGKAL